MKTVTIDVRMIPTGPAGAIAAGLLHRAGNASEFLDLVCGSGVALALASVAVTALAHVPVRSRPKPSAP